MRKILKLVLYDSSCWATNNFERSIYLGSVCSTIRNASEADFDEILICDPSKVLRANTRLQVALVQNSQIPIAIAASYSVEDNRCLLRAGYDKVCIPLFHYVTHCVEFRVLTEEFGRQVLMSVIDYEYQNGRRTVYDRHGNTLGPSIADLPFEKLSEISEFVVQNVTGDGSLSGLDYGVLDLIAALDGRPIILTGGYRGESLPATTPGPNILSVAASTYFATQHGVGGGLKSLLKIYDTCP